MLDVKSDYKYKYVFKHSDEAVSKWLRAQSDKSFSLRYLIHKMIRLYGYEDMQNIAIEEFVCVEEAECERRKAELERRIGRLVLHGRS